MRRRTPEPGATSGAPADPAGDTTANATAHKPRRRVLGLFLVASLVGIVAGGGYYHRARAQLDEGLMDMGAQMMRYAEADAQDAPRDLSLNGQVLRFSSGNVRETADRVLDVFEERCDRVDADLGPQLTELLEQHPDLLADAAASPSLREDDGRRGYVSCLDMGPNSLSLADIAARVQRYAQTGDVSDIGDMRFVFAEQRGEGDDASTHFVAMWTTGSFNVRAMFPADGDAPGQDVPDLTRPPASRRVLNSFERGHPQTLTVYHSRQSEMELESHYRGVFGRGGWRILEDADHPLDPRAPNVLVAEQGQRMVTVVLGTDAGRGHASAAVFEAR